MTRGRLPQRAGSPGLNGGGAAAVVPPGSSASRHHRQHTGSEIATCQEPCCSSHRQTLLIHPDFIRSQTVVSAHQAQSVITLGCHPTSVQFALFLSQSLDDPPERARLSNRKSPQSQLSHNNRLSWHPTLKCKQTKDPHFCLRLSLLRSSSSSVSSRNRNQKQKS